MADGGGVRDAAAVCGTDADTKGQSPGDHLLCGGTAPAGRAFAAPWECGSVRRLSESGRLPADGGAAAGRIGARGAERAGGTHRSRTGIIYIGQGG